MAPAKCSCIEITEAMGRPAVALYYCGLKSWEEADDKLGREGKGVVWNESDFGSNVLKSLRSVNMVW